MKKRIILAVVLAVIMVTALTLAACKEQAKYRVDFVLGDEADAADIVMPSIMTSELTEEPTPPEWAGHSFVAWYTSTEFTSGNSLYFPYPITKDTTLYARWSNGGNPSGEKHTVKFQTNGGTPIADMLTASIAESPKTTKAGNTFIGWYKDSKCETGKIAFPYTVTEDVTLYAKWKDETNGTFTVMFETNGGTPAIDPKQVPIDGGKIETAPVVNKENAVFEGWYNNSVFQGKPVTFPFTPKDDCTLYAKWKVNQTITPDQAAELRSYLQGKSYANFSANYLMQIQVQDNEGTFHTYYMGASDYKFANDSLLCIAPMMDDDGNFIKVNGNYVYARQYCFQRPDGTYAMYAEDTQGNFVCNDGIATGKYSYQALKSSNLEEYFYMIYAGKLAALNPNYFYKYDNKWYVQDEYVDEIGNAILGNSTGDPSTYTSHYSSFALEFDANGTLTGIEAESTATRMTSIGGVGQAITYFYYTHKIDVSKVGETTLPTEDDFIQDQDRPSGVYPEIDKNDANRPNVTWDDKTYTQADLLAALAQLKNANFQAYYSEVSNYYGTISYYTATLNNNGVYGSATEHRTNGNVVCYYKYDEATDTFYYAFPDGNIGYEVWNNKYSYKTAYEYNQYLLGIPPEGSARVGYNYVMPAPLAGYLDGAEFTFNAANHYFEISGDVDVMTFLGKFLFGSADYAYPDAGQNETYSYLRLYLNNGKLVRVLAGSDMLYDDGWTEYYVRELLVNYNATAETVTIPANVSDSFVAPGERKTDGSTAKLASALTNTGSNYTYTDQFVYDDTDELGGIFNKDGKNNADTYKYTDNLTWIMGDHYAFFQNGQAKVSYNGTNGRATYDVDPDLTLNDIEKLNSWLAWIKPINSMLSADWFYEGKDGKFYGKAEYMEELSSAIARFSGSEQFLEADAGIKFTNAYRWTVRLDYVAVTLGGSSDAPKLSNIYYSGVIHVKGTAGSHDKPFSGNANFTNIGSTSLTLPAGAGTPDAARPEVIKDYLVAYYNFEIDDNNCIHFDKIAGAVGYELRLYNKKTVDSKEVYELVGAPIAVTNGQKIADANSDLLSGDGLVTSYYATLTALGGTSHNDAIPSAYQYVELSKYGREATPTLSINGSQVTISGVANQGYHIEIAELLSGKVNEKAAKRIIDMPSGNTFNLASLNLSGQSELDNERTYQVSVVANGSNSADSPTRDSLPAILTYTHNTGKHFATRLFEAIDFSQSFNFDASSQATSYNYIIKDLNNLTNVFDDKALSELADYRVWLSFRYYQPSNKGKFRFIIYNADGQSSNDKDVVAKWEYEFAVQGTKLNGALTTFTKQGNALQSATQGGVEFSALPFSSYKQLDVTKFKEVSGDVRDYRGVIYEYTDMGADTQTILRNSSFMGQFAVEASKLTFDALRVQVAYDNDSTTGALTKMALEQSITLIAHDDDGNTYAVKYRFFDFDKVAADWPDKL